MSRDDRYAINYPHVVADELHQEYVAVNLLTGTYFSMDGTAALLWARACAGMTVREIASELGRVLGSAPPDFEEVVDSFISELVHHGLVVSRTTEPDMSGLNSVVERPYTPPVLGVHADLQDILLLDPVHDVDAAGWPVAADHSEAEVNPSSP